MRIGIVIDERDRSIDHVIDAARRVAEGGFTRFWMGQHADWDPLVALTAVAREIPELPVGTAITLTYSRHPLSLAAQALSAQAATGNRLTLGIGLSHRPIVEGQYGYSFRRPASHLRDYLTVLGPVLGGQPVDYQGTTLRAAGTVTVNGAEPPPVLVSALGPRMLQVAGELADGTITNRVGPKTLAEHIVPTITAAARAADRPAPRVLAMVMVAVTDNPSEVREHAARHFSLAGQLPSYRAMLDREGADGVADMIIAGDLRTVETRLQRMVDAGVSEFVASPLGSDTERTRTIEALRDLSS
ncbi:MAG: TIGR03564 family F420-dependent LLM class oxidoreductase [Acidimicrobiales bacterium]|nr:TIGR03564 family F420-dependent LLM class oxidoreductase [Acidimicrobiales bacterium]